VTVRVSRIAVEGSVVAFDLVVRCQVADPDRGIGATPDFCFTRARKYQKRRNRERETAEARKN
jgi:hypothetical protein